MTWQHLLIAMLAVTFGSATQSIVGFGMNLIAVPAMLLIGAEELVPGPLIVVLLIQATTLIGNDRGHADWGLLQWFLPVRVIGTLAGLAVSTRLSSDGVIVVICVLVLGAVAMSIRGWRVPSTPSAWMATGFTSGFSNVLSSIGGPPLSLAITDHTPSQQRATQGWSALCGSAMSIAALSFAQRFDWTDVRRGLILAPAALVGSVVARPLRSHLPSADALRPWVWTVAIVGTSAALVRVAL